MEPIPFGPEQVLGAKLGQFAHRILNNDTCAATVINQLNAHVESTQGLRLLRGEPSVSEQDSRLVGGIQVGFEGMAGSAKYRKFLYIDLFIFDIKTGEYEPTEALAGVVGEMPVDRRQEAFEIAWEAWISGMRDLESSAGQPLFRDIYTGEVSFGYNMPPGHGVRLELPEM